MGGSIATAGGLVFTAATNDAKFCAFDARTGEELWVTKLNTDAQSVPVTYRAKDGKQHVAIISTGSAEGGSPKVYLYTLP